MLASRNNATLSTIPLTSGTIDSTRAPLYKVVPVTKVLVEPCTALKSPFLVKRQSFRRPEAKILEDLYQCTINTSLPGMSDIQKSVKNEELMDRDCLNLVVRSMGRQDAHEFRNTKCLGWRHYVDSDWAMRPLSECSDPEHLKSSFYRGSILYNASRSHMVFIPVLHGDHWTLYAFNMCDQKLSILDSLPDATEGGDDPAERHQKTRCDVCDALTITMNFAIDFRSWEYRFPKVPRQQNSYDSGFFIVNFMRLWDGHQLVRWFPIESRELRNDFLAYMLSCKGNNVGLPDEVSRLIEALPGEMMDLKLQKIAREASTLSTEKHTEINIDPELEASAESSGVYYYRLTSDGDNVLHIAASFGNVQLVHDIKQRNGTMAAALLAAVNNIGDTPLHCAAAGGSKEMVKLFVKEMMEGVNGRAKFVRAKNLNGETCLHKAVRHGHADIVQTLISEDNKLDDLSSPTLVQIVDNKGISPLFLATTLRMMTIVRALIGRPYQQEDKHAASYAGPEGQTALHAAVMLLDKELIEVLLNWNKGLTQQADETGSTPLHFLAPLCLERRKVGRISHFIYHNILKSRKREKDLGVIELILGNDRLSALRVDSKGSLPIHVAAAHGRLDIIKELLKECPYCDSSRNASGQTFLHVAVEKKKTEIVDYVCREKKLARILNLEDQDGNTALHLAVNDVSEKIFCTLIRNRDVCLNFTNKEGRTPLDLAFLRRHQQVISFQEYSIARRIFSVLSHGGGDFGVSSWDRLTGKIVEPDWEKESERMSTSASMLAVCSVLILDASVSVPFNVVDHLKKERITGFFLPVFVASNIFTFFSSGAATFFCARAGFAMSDGSTRLKNLVTGMFCLELAAVTYVYTVGLALSMVLPGDVIRFIIVSPLFLVVLTITFRTIRSGIRTHRSVVRSKVGILQLVGIEPLWAVPPVPRYVLCTTGFFGVLLLLSIALGFGWQGYFNSIV